MSDTPTRDISALLRERVVPAGGSRHGLVIGIEKYADPRLNLRCARADAQAVYDLMTDPACGLFPPQNVKLLLDEQATRDNVLRALSALRKGCGPDDTAWVYYAGHGAPEENDLYWVTHDADVDDLYGSGLSSRQVSDALGRVRAGRLLVFLDCCHAAATALQAHPTREVLTPERLLSAYQGAGRVTFSSSGGAEKSVELVEHGHGAFTWFLTRGLRGEADAEGSGVVTVERLWAYLERKVTDASGRAGCPQTPRLAGELSHGMALTVNALAAGAKQRVADALVACCGFGDDKLANDEVAFCLEVLRHGPHGDAERELCRDFDALAAGTLPPRMLKRLIRAAMPPGAGAVAKKPTDAATQAPPADVQRPAGPGPSAAAPVPVAVVSVVPREPLAALKHLFLEDRVSAAQYDLGRRLVTADAKALDAFDADRRRRFLDMIEGRLDPAKISAALAALLTNRVGMTFVRIPAGEFVMGSDNDTVRVRRHRVRLTKPFLMGAFQVTQAQWKAVMGTDPSDFTGAKLPVESICWEDAVAFCDALAGREGRRYRLPTEAEWEYACRAGTQTTFSFGDAECRLGEFAWFKGNSEGGTHDVGTRRPNPWGLYDMHGNVAEWCSNWSAPYPGGDEVDPTGPKEPRDRRFALRVVRGGSWDTDEPRFCSSASRGSTGADYRSNNIGFRLCLDTE